MNKTSGYLMMVALFFATLNLRPAINSIAPVLESVQKDLGMSAAVASMLTSIPVLCMGIFSPVGAKLGVRYGIERVIGWSLALIGLGTAMRMFTNSTSFMLLTALIAGIGIAVIGPLSAGFIKRHFADRVPTLIALYTVAINVGQSLASGLSAPLQLALDSWQISLGIWSLLAVAAVPVWWLFVIRRVDPTLTVPSGLPMRSSKMPWKNLDAWIFTLLWGMMALVFYCVTAWLPLIIQGLGYSKIYAGGVLTICTAVQVPISFVLPFLLKRLPSPLIWMLLASAMELLGFVMILFSLWPWLAGLIIGIGAGMLFAMNLMLPIEATNSAQDAATWSAMIQSTGYVIGATGPILLGWIYDVTQSFHLSLIGMIGFIAIMMGIQLIAVLRKARKRVKAVV